MQMRESAGDLETRVRFGKDCVQPNELFDRPTVAAASLMNESDCE